MQAEPPEDSSFPQPGLIPRQAILLACWDSPDPQLQALNINCVNTPLMARPLLQRAVEQLANLGCFHITVITGTQHLASQQWLGDGKRFGVTLAYVTAQATGQGIAQLAATPHPTEERVWIASAMTIPNSDLLLELTSPTEVSSNTIIVSTKDSTLQWLGWGLLNRTLATTLIFASTDESDLEQRVLHQPALRRVDCLDALTLRSGALALHSLVQMMKQGHPAGVIAKRMHSPGIWIAGDSTIDPTATLKPPLYIGHQVRIDAGATVGPGVVIEAGSIVEAGVFIRNAWILPQTYVGHQTTLINAVVSGNRLLSLDHQVLIKISDPFLLDGDTSTRTATEGPGLIERLSALTLWLFAKPVVYWWRRQLRLKQTPLLIRERRVAFPGRMTFWFETQPTALEPPMPFTREQSPEAVVFHFLNTFYPGLIDIWQSRVKFIGLEPRTMAEVLTLSHVEQLQYASWPIGLINEATLTGQDAKEIPTSQGMPLQRSVQLLLGYGKRVRRSVALAVHSLYVATSSVDTEPLLKQASRTEHLMKRTQAKPGIVVVQLTSESLDVSNVKVFLARIKPVMVQNQTVLLDLHQLTFIDSAGLSALLECLRFMTKKNANLRLFGMCQTIQALFELVRMSRVFKIYANDVDALDDLPPG